jgi:hypothetical protein
MRPFSAASLVGFFMLSPMVVAHPLPDIPVRGSFEADGAVTIRVEIDPRCFEPDPEQETYLTHVVLTDLVSPAEQDGMKKQAQALVDQGVEFFFEPQGQFKPEWVWEFTTLGGGKLVNYDDSVVITGTWRSKLPAGTTGYSIRANDPKNLAVVFENTLHGKSVERVAILFPKEKSFTLDMSGKNASAASEPLQIAEQTTPSDAPVPAAKAGGITWWRGAALVVAAGVIIWLAKVGRS